MPLIRGKQAPRGTRLLAGTAAVIALILLGGCSASSPAPSAPAAESTSAAPSSTLLFGQSFTWPDGLRVQILSPEPAQMPSDRSPDPSASAEQAVSLRVKVSAPGGGSTDPGSVLRIGLTAGRAVATGFQDGREPGFSVGGPVPAGGTRTYSLGFLAPSGAAEWTATVTDVATRPQVVFQQDI
jgi:hypothetical protein